MFRPFQVASANFAAELSNFKLSVRNRRTLKAPFLNDFFDHKKTKTKIEIEVKVEIEIACQAVTDFSHFFHAWGG